MNPSPPPPSDPDAESADAPSRRRFDPRAIRLSARDWITRRNGLLAATVMATMYALTFSYFAVQKYNSFRATWFDLGIETQVLWLTLHGGYHAYLASGQNAIYTYPFTRLSFILVLPIYAAYQSPVTLLVTESFLLGFAALPLYFVARKLVGDELSALCIVGAYLLSFDIQGANLFDYHPENLFPLLFFTAVAAWLYQRRLVFLLSVAAGSLIDPLVSATLFLFLIQLIVREAWIPGPRSRWGHPLALARSFGRNVWRVIREDWHVTVALVALVAANAVTFYVSSLTGELGHSPTGVSFTLAGFSSQFSDKLVYLLILLMPFLLFFLFDPFFATVGLAFYAYILATDQPYPLLIFGGSYPVIVIPTILAASVFGIYRLIQGHRHSHRILSFTLSTARSGSTPAELTASGPTLRRRSPRRLCQALSVSGLAFALLFSPLSFYTAPLTYEGSSLPQNVYQLTGTDPASMFLQRVVALVPESASVLTQNNIPQLAGRFQATTFDVATPGLQPDFVLADASVNYYSNFQTALPWLENFLASGEYGILAQGQGAILLEKGYAGNAVLFDPFQTALNASAFNVFTGSSLSGGVIVHNGSLGPAQYVWYGPYATLAPGNYNVTYSVRALGSGPSNLSVITLDVLSNQTVFASTNVPFSAFSSSPGWIDVTLSFSLANYRDLLEFRGVNAETSATVEFRGAVINETSA